MKKQDSDSIRPNWDEKFMFSAIWAASRSSCLNLNTGAVIVKNKRIIATGYNGAPANIKSCLEVGCRKETCGYSFEDKGQDVCRGRHAESNAMSQIASQDLAGSSIYTFYFPCSPCAKEIVGNGITEVIFCRNYEGNRSQAEESFAEVGIRVRKLEIDIEKCFRFIKKVYEQ